MCDYLRGQAASAVVSSGTVTCESLRTLTADDGIPHNLTTMLTFTDILAQRTSDLADKLKIFLLDHSTLTDGSDTFHEFARMGVLAPSLALFPGRWGKLTDEGLRAQTELLEEIAGLFALFNVVSAGLPDTHKKELDDTKQQLLRLVGHDRTHHTSTNAVWVQAERRVRELSNLITFLAGKGSGRSLVIPDTNALYANVALEDWNFPDLPSFILCLVPTVLGEIDEHHHHHPNESVRKKAATLRAKIKEYGRRGDIMKGVPIIKNKIEFLAFPTSAAFDLARPGTLDPSRDDDQIISSMLDLVRKFPGDNVQMVTSDVLMQVKLKAMGLPYLEPPVPKT